ncbi:MAG: transposase [Dysgonamonadaceae bacterium]|nr:transposase [Dysgonamonadaceae bacterium]
MTLVDSTKIAVCHNKRNYFLPIGVFLR